MSNFYSTPKSLFREDWLSFDSSQQLDILLTIKKMPDCSKANSQSLNLTHSQSKYSVFCIASKVHSKEFLASFPFQFCGRCWEKVPGYESKTKQYLSTAWNRVPASLCGQKSRHVPSFFLVLNIRKLLQIFFLHLLQSTFLSLGASREAEIPHPKLRIPLRGKSWKVTSWKPNSVLHKASCKSIL